MCANEGLEKADALTKITNMKVHKSWILVRVSPKHFFLNQYTTPFHDQVLDTTSAILDNCEDPFVFFLKMICF